MKMTEELAIALQGYATLQLGDFHLAQDVVQEVRLRVHKEKRNIANPRAWAYRVARNLCLDFMRKKKRMRDMNGREISDTTPSGTDPAKLAEEKESAMLLTERIKSLPGRHQEVVRLKFQEGLSYSEIAEVMNETVPTVGWLLHTALQELRKQLVNA